MKFETAMLTGGKPPASDFGLQVGLQQEALSIAGLCKSLRNFGRAAEI